jgi:hypothetical protein
MKNDAARENCRFNFRKEGQLPELNKNRLDIHTKCNKPPLKLQVKYTWASIAGQAVIL